MGIPLTKIKNRMLLHFASEADRNGNYNSYIDTPDELSIFKQKSTAAIKAGIIPEEDYKAVFNLDTVELGSLGTKVANYAQKPTDYDEKYYKDVVLKCKEQINQCKEQINQYKDEIAKIEAEIARLEDPNTPVGIKANLFQRIIILTVSIISLMLATMAALAGIGAVLGGGILAAPLNAGIGAIGVIGVGAPGASTFSSTAPEATVLTPPELREASYVVEKDDSKYSQYRMLTRLYRCKDINAEMAQELRNTIPLVSEKIQQCEEQITQIEAIIDQTIAQDDFLNNKEFLPIMENIAKIMDQRDEFIKEFEGLSADEIEQKLEEYGY